jgi:hypothetical protein
MVSALLIELPSDYTYRVVFMRRKMEEILASQQRMLQRQGKPAPAVDDGRMSAMFEKHLRQMEAWIAQQKNMDAIYVHYADMIQHPVEQAKAVNGFLGRGLDEAAMVNIVNPDLYRQRK